MKLDKETVVAARRYVDHYGNQGAAERFGIHPATMSDIVNDRTNVSRDKENKIRETVGLPILPSFETVEVPPGYSVALSKPRKERKRKKRYSVPTDPIEAAEYLSLRTSTAWRQALVDELEESICDGLKLEYTFEYGYE